MVFVIELFIEQKNLNYRFCGSRFSISFLFCENDYIQNAFLRVCNMLLSHINITPTLIE